MSPAPPVHGVLSIGVTTEVTPQFTVGKRFIPRESSRWG